MKRAVIVLLLVALVDVALLVSWVAAVAVFGIEALFCALMFLTAPLAQTWDRRRVRNINRRYDERRNL